MSPCGFRAAVDDMATPPACGARRHPLCPHAQPPLLLSPFSREAAAASRRSEGDCCRRTPELPMTHIAPCGARRGGRVVDCTALEMRHTRKGIGGSNPPL